MFTRKHQEAMATRGSASRVAFGSCQKRLMFPMHFAHDRLGSEMLSLDGCPDRGPGCYDNHAVGTLVYELQHRPESKRGYVFAARTAQRFLPAFKTTTPSPEKYQHDWTLPKICPPGKAPFNSSSLRFRPADAEISPGPGAYTHDTIQNKKVSWPMKFGSPDWSKVPMLEKRALRTEDPIKSYSKSEMRLFHDKEFRKQRNRVAYLQLFY